MQLKSFFIGILFMIFFTSLGVIFVINFKPFYYHEIKALDISASSGLSEAVIRENYDALIDYCSPFYQDSLEFPSLPASPEGIQHFAEVKVIFVALYVLMAISFCILLVIVILQHKKKEYHYLKTSAITTLVLPTVVGLACSINFDRTFLLFHKLFFNNDYWLFDPATDPVIDILPSEFFLHCAIVIILFLIIGSLLQLLTYLICNKVRTGL